MADLTAAGSYYPVYDNTGTGVAASKLGANNYKLVGDGASGIGPYTRFGTRRLAAIQIQTAALNEATTPAITQSYMQKMVNALQGFGEVYYIGKPHATDGFVALVSYDTLNAGGQGASTFGGTDDYTGIDGDGTWATAATYENIETIMSLALGQAVSDVTVTGVTLTGLTFA